MKAEDLKKVLDQYLRPEYLNVQNPEHFKAQLLEALKKAMGLPG